MARVAEHLEERRSVIAVHDLLVGALAHAPGRHGLEEIHRAIDQLRRDGLITQQAIRRGSFSDVKELVNKINAYVENHNAKARPFVWVATAQSILAKFERLCSDISGTRQAPTM